MPNLKVTPFLLTRPPNPLGTGRRAASGRRKAALIEARSPETLISDRTWIRRPRKFTVIAIVTTLGLLGLIGIVIGTVLGVTPKTSDAATSSTSSTSSTLSASSISSVPPAPPVSSTSPVNSTPLVTSAPSASSTPSSSTPLAPSALLASPTPSTSLTPPVSSAPPESSQLIPTALVDALWSSSWIWLGVQALISTPVGDLALRVSLPTSATPATKAVILLAVDDSYLLYHNGQQVANSADQQLTSQLAAAYQVTPDPGPNVFALRASNIGGRAGVLASVQISYADGTTAIISSDASWRAAWQPFPDQFTSVSFDDSQWQSATVLVKYGSAPFLPGVTLISMDSLVVD